MPLALLLTTVTATAVGVAALHAAHALRKQVSALRDELAVAYPVGATASVPHARSGTAATHTDDIRTAVAEALAEERERELAEARAFWAAQEARDAADAPSALGGPTGFDTGDGAFYVPRQADFVGLEPLEPLDSLDSLDSFRSLDSRDSLESLESVESLESLEALESLDSLDALDSLGSKESLRYLDSLDSPERLDHDGLTNHPDAEDSPELAAARRRHPSHPDFVPVRTPVVTDHERTVARLEELAGTRTELSDVRPGPLGTLDVYVFADGTTLCMTPGHRETAERLAGALRAGEAPFLLGGSGVSGAYTLTFSYGGDDRGGARSGDNKAGAAEHVYILADRVIASL
ncbi:hypothetical protein [Streptomyces hebeiensis]